MDKVPLFWFSEDTELKLEGMKSHQIDIIIFAFGSCTGMVSWVMQSNLLHFVSWQLVRSDTFQWHSQVAKLPQVGHGLPLNWENFTLSIGLLVENGEFISGLMQAEINKRGMGSLSQGKLQRGLLLCLKLCHPYLAQRVSGHEVSAMSLGSSSMQTCLLGTQGIPISEPLLNLSKSVGIGRVWNVGRLQGYRC